MLKLINMDFLEQLELAPESLNNLGLLGKVHMLRGSQPSLSEMGRFVRDNETLCRHLLDAIYASIEQGQRQEIQNYFRDNRATRNQEKIDFLTKWVQEDLQLRQGMFHRKDV